MAAGVLTVVPTPIGNLDDITLRALRALREAALIATEDTRSTRHLLAHHGIGAGELCSYFEGNEAQRSAELLARLMAGERVVLVSEAGAPCISDPGARLVSACIAAGVRVEVLPGPSAVLTALIGSGLPAERFLFLGFLPRKEGPRQELLASLRAEPATLICYESPERTPRTLADLAQVLGAERRGCVARELTKLYEEYVREPLGALAARYQDAPPRGEVTLVVEGCGEAPEEIDLEAEIRRRRQEGQSPKEIAAALSLKSGKGRRQIYQMALALREPGDGSA